VRTIFDMTNTEKLKITEKNIELGIIFTPGKSHIDTLAKKFTPEIKKYFADEQVQKDFAEWQTRQSHV